MKNYLILGASGFVGRNILNVLPKNIKLSIITRKKSHVIKILKTGEPFTKLEFFKYNFIDSKNKKFFENQDVIINSIGAYPNGNNKHVLRSLNYKLPKKIYDLSLNKKTKIFININTILKNRKSIYVYYKHKLSDYFKKYKANIKGKTKTLDLYVSHLYGDKLNKKEFIFNILKNIKENKKSISLTKGLQKRDFLHINDFKNLIKEILKLDINFKYNRIDIGSYKSYAIRDVVIQIKKLTKSKINLKFGNKDYKYGEEFYMKCNKNDKIGLKYNPKITLVKGIKLLINDLKE